MSTAAPSGSAPPLLSVRDLRTSFRTDAGLARAVDGVSFTIGAGEAVSLVGESGCGKSATALSLMGLLPRSATIEPDSHVVFEQRELLTLSPRAWCAVRGTRIGMAFQDTRTALDPVFSVGAQVAEVVRAHVAGVSRRAAWDRAVAMLAATGMPSAAECAHQYPHELSGGTLQRVMLAIALVLHPALLIADEPTSALDVTVQAQILALLRDCQERMRMAMLLITHDLSVAAAVADRVIVMYAGEIIEDAPASALFAAPHHPYAAALLHAVPRVGERLDRLAVIPGVVPPATAWPTGCRFRERCAFAWDRCETEHPPLYTLTPTHHSRCHLAAEPAHRPATPALSAVA